MKKKSSQKELQVKEWLKRARDDELTAKSILKHRDSPPSPVCFISQQMAEKYLKAFLVFKKKWFLKIHQLDKLLELIIKIDYSFKNLKDEVIFLNAFYVETRYPGDYPEFSWHEAEQAFKSACKIKEFVIDKIKFS